jgi:hypothetical protein
MTFFCFLWDGGSEESENEVILSNTNGAGVYARSIE